MSVDIRYSYDGVPSVKAFSRSTKFIRGLRGPWGSGKSSGCVMECIKIGAAQKKGADKKRRARIVVVRNSYRQLQDTTIRTVHDWIPPAVFGQWLSSEHRYVIDRLAPDLEIEMLFRALDRPDQVSNLLSSEYTLAWVNEAREVPWTVIQALQGRVGRFPPERDGGAVRAGLIMDTNPPDTDSWWYRLFEERRPENAAQFVQPSGLSPQAENKAKLPPSYYENLMQSMDEDQIRVYIRGEYGYIQDGMPVYPEYNDQLHCAEVEPIPGLEIHRGFDFGLTPACVWTQVLPDGRWLIFDELTSENMDIYTFGDEVNERHGREWSKLGRVTDIGDPAGMARSPTAKPTDANTCFAILQGKEINVEPGEQTLALRLASVRVPLKALVGGKPRLIIHPRCKTLRKAFQGRYKYRRVQISGSTRYQDQPDKDEWSHVSDALQYVATRLFGQALVARQTADEDVSSWHNRKTNWRVA